jgi:DNA-binding winged helix-turn-helix (wHTH) protein
VTTTLADLVRSSTDTEPGDDHPWLDPDGLLRRGDRWVAVSPHEEAVLHLLLARWGRMVPRASLSDAVWPDGSASSRALNTLVGRLRKRLDPLGLTIETIRARGFLLAYSQEPEAPHSEPTHVGLADVLSEGPSWLIS